MAKSPAVLDLSYKFTSRKLSKEGEVISTTVGEALTFLDGMTPEEIICRYALREMALAKNSARVKTGAPASRIYQNTNLPPEVASMLATVKAAVAAAVPTMAPKAPSAPKAAPVAPLDLSDPLEAATAQVLAESTPKVGEAAGARASNAGFRANDATKRAPKARKAAKLAPVAPAEPVKAPPVPVATPEVVKAAPPVVRSLSGLPADRMAALRAKQAARIAAKHATV